MLGVTPSSPQANPSLFLSNANHFFALSLFPLALAISLLQLSPLLPKRKTMSEHRRNHLIKPKILCSLDQLFVINSVLPTHLKTSFHNLKSFHPSNPRPMANAQTYTMVTKSQNFTHQIEPDSPLDWHCLCVLIIVWFCICLFHFL